MPNSEQDIERKEREIPRLATRAVREACERAHRRGSVYVSGQEAGWTGIFEVFPDGTRARIKPIEPPAPISAGTQARIP